jgi:hypothetical protein
MSDKGKSPDPPDYIGAAREQGKQNLEAIRAGAALNRVNQINPYGSTSYRHLGGDRWEQTTSLSPDQQAILDQQERNQIDLGRIAGGRLSQVEGQGALDLSGLPGQVTSTPASQFRTDVGAPSVAQRGVDLSGVTDLPTDLSAERRRVEDTLYGSATRQLDPQFQREEEALRTRLINSGNTEGSEAWRNAMDEFSRRKEAAYGDARDRAILAGGGEESRMLADALRTRQQGVSEAFGTGQFANQAAAQEFANEMQRLGVFNAAQADEFQQAQANARLQNEGRATGLSELLTQRNQPLQEFMALWGGAPAPGMQSPSVPQAGTPQPGDYQGAVGQQYGASMDAYNAQQARNAQNANALINLAGIAANYYSDERLKTDVEKVGELPHGVGVYEYEYRGDPTHARHTGVMAQEVERDQPDAVTTDEDGLRMVDYRKVLAKALRSAAWAG